MHFITGGAFNGKRAWVKKAYRIEQKEGWISAYEKKELPLDLTDISQNVIILEGIELWLKDLTVKFDINQSRILWNGNLDKWLEWEKSGKGRKFILIGTDLSRGIVPLEKENRIWRDLTGWAYQDTAAKSERVDVIWYGLNHTIKLGGL